MESGAGTLKKSWHTIWNRPATPHGKHMLQGNPLRITSKVPLTAPAAAGTRVPAAPSSAAPKTLKDDR
ncbi:hypothetical protein ACX80S_18600 [Arthrobacter sp. RHLT1-20]